MASIEQVTQGTQTATLDTEHSLSTQTTADVFQLVLNLANMAPGDVLIVRVKAKVLTGGSAVTALQHTFEGAQAEDWVVTDPFPSAHSIEFTIEQTDGTGRSYEWAVLRVPS